VSDPAPTAAPDDPPVPEDLAALAELLSRAGFVAPEEEAAELLASASTSDGSAGGSANPSGNDRRLKALVARRLTGEPLAWITGRTTFCDLVIRVDPGVYVPRWHSQELAEAARARLPDAGVAVDLCTGSGAIAAALSTCHPLARVVATDLSEAAVACARGNGVEAYQGDLFDPLPGDLAGRVDVVVAVVPYVPTSALPLLQRDTVAFESTLPYDGGPDGTDILRRVLTESPRFLRPGGVVLLELGGEQAEAIQEDLDRLGYGDRTVSLDEERDVRSIEARWPT
jgi:release factor glutamine methyltransferase